MLTILVPTSPEVRCDFVWYMYLQARFYLWKTCL